MNVQFQLYEVRREDKEVTIQVTRKIGILHRSSKEGSIKDGEKLCEIEEGVLHSAMKTLKKGGSWKCNVCGVETVSDLTKKTITPMLSTWGVVGLKAGIVGRKKI